MLRRTKFAVCLETHTKRTHTLRENVEFWNVKPGGRARSEPGGTR